MFSLRCCYDHRKISTYRLIKKIMTLSVDKRYAETEHRVVSQLLLKIFTIVTNPRDRVGGAE